MDEIEIFKLFGSIFVDSAAAQESISKTEQKAEGLTGKLGSGIKTAAKWGTAIVGAATVVGAGMMAMANKTAEATDHIDKMSQKIGISREAYQELDFVTSQCGGSVDNLKNGMKTLTNQMQMASQGSKTATSAFDALGLSWEDGNGKLKDQETMMWEAFTALQNVEDQTQKAALATDLFGKAGTDLMPMLNGATGSIEEMRQKAHELGLVLSDDTIDAGVKFTDTMDQLKRSFSTIGVEIGGAFLPLLQQVAEGVINAMPTIKEVIGEVVDFIKSTMESAAEFWAENGETIKTIVSAAWTVIKEIITTVMKVIQSVVEVVTAVIEGDWEKFWQAIHKILMAQGELFFNAGKAILTFLWDGLKEVWNSICDWVEEKVKWIADKLMFWRDSKDEMSNDDDDDDSPKKPKPTPTPTQNVPQSSHSKSVAAAKARHSHAAGLPYVPYDGYQAELHRGETVLNANDTKSFIADIINAMSVLKGGTGGDNGEINLHLTIQLGDTTIEEQIYQSYNNAARRHGDTAEAR